MKLTDVEIKQVFTRARPPFSLHGLLTSVHVTTAQAYCKITSFMLNTGMGFTLIAT